MSGLSCFPWATQRARAPPPGYDLAVTTLAVIGDVHAKLGRLDRVLHHVRERAPDGVLLVGDIGHPDPQRWGRSDPRRHAKYLTSVEAALRRVAATGLPFAWVPGNHDLRDVPGEGNADGRVVEVAGLRVHGIGGAGPDHFGFPYEWEEDHVRALPEPPCDVLLCHAPPARTVLAWVPLSGQQAGSEAIRERAERHKGVLVCGHIHESPGAIWLGECLCVNAGALGEPFGRAQVAFVRWDGPDTRPSAIHDVL